MANYETNLNWYKNMDKFSIDAQKVLLALSHQKYRWRTKDRLAVVTGLSTERLDAVLADLISEGYVRPSFSKAKDLIFGLRERVG